MMFVELAMHAYACMFTLIPVPRQADFPVSPVSPVNLVPRRAGFPDASPGPGGETGWDGTPGGGMAA